MRMRFGNSGWVAVDGVGLPGLLYVRLRDVGGRLRINELYIDASEEREDVEGGHLRQLPLAKIEAAANEHVDLVRSGLEMAGPDLSTLASYYATSFGSVERQIAEGNWVVASFAAQHLPDGVNSDHDPDTGAAVMRVPKSAQSGTEKRLTSTYRLASGPGKDGLTDAFLNDVKRAYNAALSRGEKPNKAIAEQTRYERRTVERWVYTARQRGIMPRGTRGKVG